MVEEIVAALAKLPQDTVTDSIKETIAHGDDASKRIVLIHAVLNADRENKERNSALVERLCKSDQSGQVRALANQIWLDRLGKKPSDVQREALLSDSRPLAKAVLMTLFKTEQYPFGHEQGIVSGRIQVDGKVTFGAYIRNIALRSVTEGEEFRETETHKLLLATGAEIVRQWEPSLDDLAMHHCIEVVDMPAAAQQIDNETRKAASRFLHGRLEEMLLKRQESNSLIQKFEMKMWVMYMVKALIAIDGKRPDELDKYKMEKDTARYTEFEKWTSDLRDGSKDAERVSGFWVVVYPTETMDVLFRVGADQLKEQSADGSLASRSRVRSSTQPQLRLFKQLPLAITIAYAAQRVEDAKTQQVLSAVLGVLTSRELAELQFSIPLDAHAESLLNIAKNSAVGLACGSVLRLAQLGGADEAKVQDVAMERLESCSPYELPWLVECLANVKNLSITDEQIQKINERVLAVVTKSNTVERSKIEPCFIAVLKLNERLKFRCVGAIPILRAAVGVRNAEYRIRWPSSPSSRYQNDSVPRAWRMIGDGVPHPVFRQALESIINNPPADEPLLKHLVSREPFLSRVSADTLGKQINEAIEAIRRAIAEQANGVKEVEVKAE